MLELRSWQRGWEGLCGAGDGDRGTSQVMSSPASVAFYGVRFEIAEEEIPGLEERSDPRLVSAMRNGLKHYWSNFDAPAERYCLFVGSKLGILGPEGQDEVVLDGQDLQAVIADTDRKLREGGFAEVPRLYIQWQSDA